MAAYGEMTRQPPPFERVRIPTLLVLGETSYLPYDHLLDAHRAAAGDGLEVAGVSGGHTVLWDAFAESAAAIEAFSTASRGARARLDRRASCARTQLVMRGDALTRPRGALAFGTARWPRASARRAPSSCGLAEGTALAAPSADDRHRDACSAAATSCSRRLLQALDRREAALRRATSTASALGKSLTTGARPRQAGAEGPRFRYPNGSFRSPRSIGNLGSDLGRPPAAGRCCASRPGGCR